MRLTTFVILLTLILPCAASAVSISSVIGGGVCDISATGCVRPPETPELLCNGTGAILNCPQFFHPDWTQSPGSKFYGITNRVNPPIYVVSTDGGVTFAAVTTQPFTAAVLNLGASMAVASDGSLLAASGQGASTCIIRRSTDQGATWTTPFTSAVQVCSLLFSAPLPPNMYCAESGGYCAIMNISSGATLTVIYSTNSGASWTIGASYSHVSSDSRTWGPIVSADATYGTIVRGTNSTGGQPFGTKSGSDFAATLSFAAPVNLNCRPFLVGSVARAVCAPTAGGSTYQFVQGAFLGAAPSVLNSFTVPDTSGTLEPQVIGFDSNFGYMIQPSPSVTTRLNLFRTTDGWGSVTLAATITPATVPISGCCKGNIMRWGNRIYFSSGASSTQAFLGVIR